MAEMHQEQPAIIFWALKTEEEKKHNLGVTNIKDQYAPNNKLWSDLFKVYYQKKLKFKAGYQISILS